MDSDLDDKPPAPPVRIISAHKGDHQSSKPLPSVPENVEGKKKKKIKNIFTGGDDKCRTYL